MSHRVPVHLHQRRFTIDLGPFTATLGGGSDDSSTTAPTPTASATDHDTTSSSSKSAKTSKDATTSETSSSSRSDSHRTSTTTTSSSSIISSSSITSTTASITSTSTPSQTTQTAAAASTTAAGSSSSHSSGTSPGLIAFAVILCIAFLGAIIWIVTMRRHARQREWTFQQHQRIFARFDKSKGANDSESDFRPNTSHTTTSSLHPLVPTDDRNAWPAGTGASVIGAGPSIISNRDWEQDQGPRKPTIDAAKPKRKPVPPPKEFKKKTFSQYLPYLLPQHHSAEVIELGKAEQQVYQKPVYKQTG